MGDPFVRPGLEYAPHVEQVLLKHEGTMTLETTKDDWMRYQHRDTLAAIIEHRDQIEYLCIAENLPPAKMERILLERMVDPIAKR
ncbi:conserved hypothetical protein [Leishmania braziliensis MHOM/BR/75/M2904]|uniref:Splicing factor 3B subunit 10 n=2 Tax=Leishmania braziliensis TaxID=5660 RepID=A4HN80_LEIBR|nr:conserved hypothetical protein [Leishmania braziliensis MHOM/BR/75/M2904]KAI5689479.1 Splicing factor 3B subunit 10 [Leishmania braziliensis]CAJ2480697.1 unnamed protein product [Leishmania braziliensis]CAJ2481032.1 unnamed protein product [Leishmania braziliensis]CAM43625.1 conserved hypothetical protein [Leishmania braziliensis MHOM/BR/75/M2904]SYZ69680.1 Splicing_factor_3B_subunit_10_(SF3b10) [Leishmania braziliensis MHOM/BR/75/M2904]